MKKFISILLALLLALSLLSGCAERMEGGNEYAPIPYAWQEQRDGSYKFIIQGVTPEGEQWVTSYDETKVQLGEPIVDKDGFTSYKVSVLDMGDSMIYFDLVSADAIAHTSYRIKIRVNYSNAGILLSDEGYLEYTDEQTVGTGTEYPLTYEKYNDTTLVFYLTDKENAAWEADVVDSEGSQLISVGPALEMEGYTAFVVSLGSVAVNVSEEAVADLVDIAQGLTVEEEETASATSVGEMGVAYEPTEEELAAAEEANAAVTTAYINFSLYKANLSYKVTITYSFNEGFQIAGVKQGTYEKATPPYVGASLSVDEETGGVFLTSDGTYQDRPEEFEFLDPETEETSTGEFSKEIDKEKAMTEDKTKEEKE